MKLSYRGCPYTSVVPEIPTIEQSFEGQFLGLSRTLTTSYRTGMSNATIPLTYRGQHYLGDRS
jgi:hypothetical protein